MEIQEAQEKLENMHFDDIVKSYCNKVNDLEREKLSNKEMLIKLDQMEKANVKHVELLKYIRDNPKTWKAGGIGGQDQYAGMPSMLRYIDEIIDELITPPKTT